MIHNSASGRVRSHLETLIAAGSVGDRLPSVRQLMAELGASPTTIRSAVSDLVRSGVVEAISGSGTFIAAVPRARPMVVADHAWQSVTLSPELEDHSMLEPIRALAGPGVIDLSSGYPEVDLQPVSLIAAAVRDAARRPGSFGRVSSEGIDPLRSWFAEKIDPQLRHRVLIMPGGQAALSLIFRAVCMPGDTVLMESPTYAGALVAVRSAGLVPVPVPMDSGGLCVDQLEPIIQQSGARVLFVQPRYQNPSGVTMERDRREALLGLAQKYRLMIVEDDWISDLAKVGESAGPLASLDDHGHVIHLRSLTKSVAPGIRVAALASAGSIAARLHQVRSAEDYFVSPLLQETALGVVTSPRWPGHLRRLRVALVERRSCLRNALEGIPGLHVESGLGESVSPLHVWCRVDGVGLGQDLREVALREGVSIVDGRRWYPGTSEGVMIRLSTAASDLQQIETGVARLATALQSLSLD